MKLNWMVAALAAIALTFPVLAYADDTTLAPAPKHHPTHHHFAASPAVAVASNPGAFNDKWAGSYSNHENTFVTVKRLTFSKEKDGSLKIRGALVGFPEEVSIGETVAEPYADRNNKNNPDEVLASFTSDRFKPLIVITPAGSNASPLTVINFTCYMKDVDGAKLHINGTLYREP